MKKKRGRRAQHLDLRCTAAEKRQWVQAARRAGLTLSAWCRQRLRPPANGHGGSHG